MELVSLESLIQYKKAYYAGSPLVSDERYDALEEIFRQNNPGVDIPVDDGFQDRDVFKEPYVSLRKLDTQSAISWLGTRKAYVMPKIDGVSMEFRLFKGGFQAVTRGGKDRTEAVKRSLDPEALRSLRQAIEKYPGEQLVFRAECYLPASLKEEVEAAGYANLRNLCAGLINSDSGNEFSGKMLYKAWNWLGSPLLSHEDSLNTLKQLGVSALGGFSTRDQKILFDWLVELSDLEKAEKERTRLENLSEGYEVDGYVIFLDDKTNWDYYKTEEISTKSYYDFAVAWKFPSRTAESIILDVEWNTGDAGWITPVAKIKPVEIGGVMVKSINLFNFRNLEELNVKIGSLVKVRRANDVIPHINEPCRDTELSQPIQLPEVCPNCEGQVESVGPRLQCINPNCSLKFFGVMMAWVGAHEMKHFKEEAIKFLEPFFKESDLHPIVRLYELKESDVHALFGTPGKAKRFWENFSAAKEQTDQVKILQALKIRNVGFRHSKNLITEAGSFARLQDHLKFLIATENIKIAEYNVYEWIDANQKDYEDLCNLIDRLQVPTPKHSSTPKTLRGSVVVTGSIPGLGRKEVQKVVEDLGWKFASGVTKETSYLISEETSGSSKFKKAADLNVPIINWSGFLTICEQPELSVVD